MRRCVALILCTATLALTACSSSNRASRASADRGAYASSVNGGLAVGDNVGSVAFREPVSSNERFVTVPVNAD